MNPESSPEQKPTPTTAQSNSVVIYACSGCSDAGELADLTARALANQGVGKMSCLAGIGGRVKPLMMEAGRASHIVAIDGCPLNCARHTLTQAGFENVHQLELHRIGFRKGSCPPTATRLALAVTTGTELIKAITQSAPAPEPGPVSSLVPSP
jgi:uncharacterized metal-binding protein